MFLLRVSHACLISRNGRPRFNRTQKQRSGRDKSLTLQRERAKGGEYCECSENASEATEGCLCDRKNKQIHQRSSAHVINDA